MRLYFGLNLRSVRAGRQCEASTPSPCEALSFASGKEACLCKLPLIDLAGQTHVAKPLAGKCLGQRSPLCPALRAEKSRGEVVGPPCGIPYDSKSSS